MKERELGEIERTVAAYLKALESRNDRAVYAQSFSLQKNAADWIPPLLKENQAFRRIGIRGETAAALSDLESPPMKAIYVCSAIRENIPRCLTAAKKSCKALIGMGYLPVSPFVMFSGVLDYESPLERNIGMTLGLESIRFCSELWVFSKRATGEMEKELERAALLKIPVRRMTD